MRTLSLGFALVAALVFAAGAAFAYPSTEDCVTCHTGFPGFGPTHSLHLEFVNGCTWCHTTTGDTPATSSSGSDPENSCSGCHSGGGTAQHHVTTGAAGCGCHNNTVTWPRGTEDAAGPYYGTAATSLQVWNACFDGIDQDGDDIYDGDDPDCTGVPNDERSWSVIKQIYGSE